MTIILIAWPQAGSAFFAPFFSSPMPAGFPGLVDDYVDGKFALNKHLVSLSTVTIYCRVPGSSMIGTGICDDDLLIVDRAITPAQGDVVLAGIVIRSIGSYHVRIG